MTAPPPPLTPAFWATFWKDPIPHNARSVWWRLLINKLPTGVYFHLIIPGKVGVLCRVCLTQAETNKHLLFSCPKKLEVWQVKPDNDVPLFLLIGVILATIWRYRFAFDIEGQVFDPRILLAAIDMALTQARA
ncbi:hypothetical protein EC991_011452 [Linnemannia zychae]|nr:hypothetical protein EC991_011452 [Linnemannia zychae]